MESVVLVIHLILALAIIGLVLLQRSEGGGLGIGGGGGGGGLGGLATAKGTANALTKATALCATGFFITSLTLGVLAGGQSRVNQGILENISATEAVEENAQTIPDIEDVPTGITYTPPKEMPPVETKTQAPEPATKDSVKEPATNDIPEPPTSAE